MCERDQEKERKNSLNKDKQIVRETLKQKEKDRNKI